MRLNKMHYRCYMRILDVHRIYYLIVSKCNFIIFFRNLTFYSWVYFTLDTFDIL